MIARSPREGSTGLSVSMGRSPERLRQQPARDNAALGTHRRPERRPRRRRRQDPRAAPSSTAPAVATASRQRRHRHRNAARHRQHRVVVGRPPHHARTRTRGEHAHGKETQKREGRGHPGITKQKKRIKEKKTGAPRDNNARCRRCAHCRLPERWISEISR